LTTKAREPVGSLATALSHTERLLADRPALAAQQAREILKVVPGQREAMLLLARALTATKDLGAAEAALRQASRLFPADGAVQRALGDLLHLAGQPEEADRAHLTAMQLGVHDPELIQAALALSDRRIPEAEAILRARLKAEPTDVAAIRMLAEVAGRLGRVDDAASLLARALELCPSFREARRNYALMLQRQEKPLEALAQADRLLAETPDDPGLATLEAGILVRLGDFAAAVALYEAALAQMPDEPKVWMSYGHVLKTLGRQAEGVAAYRRALDQAPELGEAWWSLANLKTFAFSSPDLAVMRDQLARADLDESDRLHLHFALAKALEDQRDYAQAFDHYGRGADIRRAQLGYKGERITARRRRAQAVFDREFFEARRGQGCPSRDPVFIVGLPRSGSTLVEQILASHSEIEGTMELPDLPTLARELGDDGADEAYPARLATLTPDDLRELGEAYLERTRIQRKTGRPRFIDKLPNNWLHVGLIQLILPNATIIDARRHPLGCCLSGFKQHFATGQAFTYGLEDVGRYYRDYAALMAHFDAVLPGRVHRVLYERMVADTEVEVRRLLAHMGLAFEPACLAFWTNDRAVRTASSEQVRRPIFGEGLDQWRNFEPWLDPLKAALGEVLDAYPGVPAGLD
jgi:Tfp pilus assembly protein PilF